ncbi:uncharacterized protein LOC119292382 [Triticum dicoccoides]|uniref:uncharacterized protein LOC119292382 n=1 Tax=Triticum dicoccoides TaxID=85692 RepID=UPI000E79CBA1|nr:uncharacterized protein LOC119292382 [Triticum dicoccoides]XP_044450007.1 uncharacterized protein LOC123181740 [Triticum aestivum]
MEPAERGAPAKGGAQHRPSLPAADDQTSGQDRSQAKRIDNSGFKFLKTLYPESLKNQIKGRGEKTSQQLPENECPLPYISGKRKRPEPLADSSDSYSRSFLPSHDNDANGPLSSLKI